MTRKARRRAGRRLLIAGSLLCLIVVVTEWKGAEWWSRVNMAKLHQWYIVLVRGRIVIGVRGTAGSFNRAIPAAGCRLVHAPAWSPDSWKAKLVPHRFDEPQNTGVSVPLHFPAVLFLIFGFGLRISKRQEPGHCPVCSYDVRGLGTDVCPECGENLASMTSI